MIQSYLDWAVLTGFVCLYALVSGRLQRTPFSAAMVFLLGGWLLSPACLGVLHLAVDSEGLRGVDEFSLALILFTDAALGQTVVTNRNVPASIREGLSAESGLNEGICVPFLLLLRALPASHSTPQATENLGLLAQLFLQQIGVGVLVGVALASVSSWASDHCSRHGWIEPDWGPVLPEGWLWWPRPDAGVRPGDDARSHQQAWPASACGE